MNYSRFSLLILIFSLPCFAQNSADIDLSVKEYFGQTPPGIIPEIFAPGFISTDEFEFAGTFNTEGNEYYFTRRPTLQGSANRIFFTKYKKGKWTEPELAGFAMDVFEYEPNISPDGKRLFFHSNRPGNNGNADAWFLEKTDSDWGTPQYISEPLYTGFIMYVTETKNRKIFFTGGFDGTFGIFSAHFENGRYIDPKPFPSKEKIFRGAHPFIDPDEKYIIFDMQPSGPGKPELFISFKLATGEWCKPINMGPEINKTKSEFAASVSHNGNYLFFHREENGIGNIYWVDAEIIKSNKK